jgi:hypothetical protein
MSKYTPGPWIARKDGSVTDLCDRIIATRVAAHDIRSISIANQFCAQDDGGEANAQLIAAAPSLLSALQGCVELLEQLGADGEPGDMPAPTLESARLSIAKALGGAK